MTPEIKLIEEQIDRRKRVGRDGCKRLGVEKALHQTHYLLINWGEQPCALSTRVDIRVDVDVWKILGGLISETHSTLQQLLAPEPPPWSLYHIL